jgi:DNA-binding transcriptional LysR family regulator
LINLSDSNIKSIIFITFICLLVKIIQIEYQSIKYFIELIQEGSFSAAAQKLGITQPALSLQIKSLEDELEFRLIDRTRKPFELTPEGEVVLEKARKL